MDIRQLKYFQFTVECGSLSAAARELYISEQALSRAMNALEDELGFPLLTRSRAGVTPTPDGREFLNHATKVLADYAQLKNAARIIKTKKREEPLKVGFYEGFLGGENALMPISVLSNYVDTHPEIELHIVEKPNDIIRDMTVSKEVEIGIFAGEVPANCSCTVLAHQHLSLVVSKKDPLATKDALTWHDLDGKSLIHLNGTDRMPHMLERSASQHGVTFKSTYIQASTSTCLSFVEENRGVMFLDARENWQANLDKVRFIPFDSEEKPIRPSISIAWADNSNLSSNKMGFVHFILDRFDR